MQDLLNHIVKVLGVKGIANAESLLVINKEAGRGDVALPCFVLAKKRKSSPVELAKQIAGQIKTDEFIASVQAIGPFVNFFFQPEALVRAALAQAGEVTVKEKSAESVMVEFFHANTHKTVHIGHIRNISLGESICRLMEAVGKKVIRTNYQGDIGPHVAKCLWAMKKFGKEVPKTRRSAWLADLYVRGNTASEENETLKQEIREVNKQIYAHDVEWNKLYKETRQWCLDDFEEIYKNWGVKYDRFYFESEVEGPSKSIVEDLVKKGVLELSQGAIIANLEKEGLQVLVIITGDGTPLYGAKDLALAELKNKEYPDLGKSLHLVGHEQELYFNQLFAIFKKANFSLAQKSEHVVYALVRLAEGKMSSRAGNVVTYFDLMDKLTALATEEAKKRHTEWNNEQVSKTALAVALAGLKFSMLKSEPNKEIVFDEKAALQFEGDTGPYLLYTYARCQSILRKNNCHPGGSAATDRIQTWMLSLRSSMTKWLAWDDKLGQGTGVKVQGLGLTEPAERALLCNLLQFSDKVYEAATTRRPSTLASYLLETAQLFNTFYHKHKVLDAPADIRQARLELVNAVAKTLQTGLHLLGIETVEEI